MLLKRSMLERSLVSDQTAGKHSLQADVRILLLQGLATWLLLQSGRLN